MTDLLDIRNLNLSFSTYGRRQQVLKNVSLKVPDGGRVALIGETGSGKSVTSKAVIGTLPRNASVESGEIFFEGTDVLKLNPLQREAMKGTAFSIIMQDPLSSFNPVFTIGRHLDDVLRYADRRLGTDRSASDRLDRIGQVLKQVQLADTQRILQSYPSQLSGGMRQRVLIALALLHQPRLLIADEPGTALDVTTQDEIMKLINRLVDENGLSLLMITHNLGVVRQMADDIYVMRHGVLVEHGNRAQILNHPKEDYTQRLVDAIPALYGDRVTEIAHQDGDTLIEVDNVEKAFTLGGFLAKKTHNQAVKPTSLRIGRGEIVGLGGESGSGKTTLARLIMGRIAPTSGSVQVDGQDVTQTHDSVWFRRKIQMVYQNPGTSLNPKRTIAQTLSVPLSFAGLDKPSMDARIAKLLAQVELPASYAGKYPHELSGGQKQRVAIARALAAEPEILVLDEPTSALDVSVQKNVIALLLRLREELGLTFLFISHDLSLMRNFCTRVLIMLRGELVEQGPPAKVFDAPEHPYTRALIAAVPVMSDAEEAMKPKVDDAERRQFLVDTTLTSEG